MVREVRTRSNCSVLTCVNYRNTSKEACSRFPANKKVAEDWVRAIKNPNLHVEEAHIYCKTKFVCHRHFATSQFNTPERLRLNRGTVPTLFLPSSDSSENELPAPQTSKDVLSSVRMKHMRMLQAIRDECEPREANVKEETSVGTGEEVGSQLLSHLDSGMHNSDCSNVKDLQPSQKGEERVEMPVHEDIQSGEEIFTDSSMLQHPGSNGKQTDLQNLCRETVTRIGGTAVNLRDEPEIWDTAANHWDSDEYEDVRFIPNEPCTVATDTWEYLPNQLCRLCASTGEHPKQSIVGWLGMLNEIIPDLVALNDGLPQHVCRPCVNKLYTCNKIKLDFIEAYNKLQESLGFTKSPGIQFIDLEPAAYSHQTLHDVREEDIVSEDEEQLVAEIPSEGVSSDTPNSRNDLLEEEATSNNEGDLALSLESTILDTDDETTIHGNWRHRTSEGRSEIAPNSRNDFVEEEMTLNTVGDMCLNPEESIISDAEDEATIHGNLIQDKLDTVENTSAACDMAIPKAQWRRNEKFKYVCGECEEMFTKRGALNAHRRRHHTSAKVFECEYCMKQCTYSSQLDDHRRIHTRELPYMCEICGKCFRNMTQLKNHEYVHKPPSYTCHICKKNFRSRLYLTQHKKVHSIDTKLICELCGKILYTPFSLQIHLRIHTGEKPFQCDICGKCFIAAVRLKRHRALHTGRKFRCETCGKLFYYKHTLIQHQECHGNLKHYKCQICLQGFTNSRNRYKHRKETCNLPICIVCNEIFPTDKILEEHRTREHSEEEVALAAKSHRKLYFKCCPVCSEAVYGKGNMLKHMKEHHKHYNYTPFACEQCPKTFSTAHSLRKHRIWHSEQRSFSCTNCGKKFKTWNTLKWHDLSVHQNECPFQCHYCDRQFKRLSDLIVHKMKHTGERPFPCPICMQRFFTKSDMLKHAKKHSQSSKNVAWKEVVEGTIPVSDFVFSSPDLS